MVAAGEMDSSYCVDASIQIAPTKITAPNNHFILWFSRNSCCYRDALTEQVPD
jgi:hypothetical protein